jgi:hypothetical protein
MGPDGISPLEGENQGIIGLDVDENAVLLDNIIR